jgi:O-antigen ligase
VLLAGICLLGLMLARQRYEQVLFALGGMAGWAVSLLSGSRGGWLSILILLWFAWRLLAQTQLAKWRWPLLLLMSGAVATAALHPSSPVHHRVQSAVSDVVNYVQKGDGSTSVGARLAMWQFAASIATEKPLLGFGFQGARDRWQQSIDAGEYTAPIGGRHFHNEMIQTYITTGLVGLMLVLLVYGSGLRLFYQHRQWHGGQHNVFAVTGMLVLLMYLEFGLSNGVWSNNSNRQIFMFLLMALSGLAMIKAGQETRHA